MEQSVQSMAVTRYSCGQPRVQGRSEEQFSDHPGRFDTTEAFVETVVVEDESAVIETKAVQQSGMEVVHADSIFDGVVTEVVGFSIRGAALNATPGQPDREPVCAVVTSRFPRLLGEWQAAELTSPYQ